MHTQYLYIRYYLLITITLLNNLTGILQIILIHATINGKSDITQFKKGYIYINQTDLV